MVASSEMIDKMSVKYKLFHVEQFVNFLSI